ncbi:YIP1 family protein [Mechercharimyces sp. CAU 1602]|uniref:YIP1 family protein n=1 Tax=Mechercharimyces sp. CAU 1602 TaxID=2973933 RepID=UPI0021625564|nr:YIP1 family protein [Mechercharimyces sp. CAU 1602]MCS1352840.1 YIP1 family protein [Mechercharimyces sp. CAU 1602]
MDLDVYRQWMLSVGVSTRETITDILDWPTTYMPWVWIAIFGINFTLTQMFLFDGREWAPLSEIFSKSLILGPCIGIGFWLLFCSLITLIGWMFQRKVSWSRTFTASAWATVPYNVKGIVLIPQILLFGDELFARSTPELNQSATLTLLYLFFLLVDLLCIIWFYIVLVKSISVAHQVAVWKASMVMVLSLCMVWIISLEIFNTLFFPL